MKGVGKKRQVFFFFCVQPGQMISDFGSFLDMPYKKKVFSDHKRSFH